MVDSSPYHTPSLMACLLWIQEGDLQVTRSNWALPYLVAFDGRSCGLVEKYGHLLTIQRADDVDLPLPGGLLHWRESVE